jgi:hypothetical protein
MRICRQAQACGRFPYYCLGQGVGTAIRLANRDVNRIESGSEREGDPTVQARRNDHAKDLPEDSHFPGLREMFERAHRFGLKKD